MCGSDSECSIDPQTIKELQFFEEAISDVDIEVTAKQYLMSSPIFAAREKTIAKIPSFWAATLDNANHELDDVLTPADLEILTAALVSLEVTRPEIPATAQFTDMGIDKFGEPRSLQFIFRFAENDWFHDKELIKTFYFRFGKDGSAGLVSEPIKINWKSEDKDVTCGLSDAALNFFNAQKAEPSQQLDGILANAARYARDAAAKKMPEYQTLLKKIEANAGRSQSFFNFFSYRGRWVSAAEHAEAKAKMTANRTAAQSGQEVAEDDEEDDEEEEEDGDLEPAEEASEVFPAGHEVAVTIAEDVYPNAIDFFMGNHMETDDEDEDDE